MDSCCKNDFTENPQFEQIRNRNESRVRKGMERLFAEEGASELTEKDKCDIYAIALNALPARYIQKGTIVVQEPVRESEVDKVVREAYECVLVQPKP